MQRIHSILATVALLCLAPTAIPSSGQGAWVQPRGNAYLKLSYGASTAADQYTFDGRVKQYADNVEDYAFFDRSFYLYMESGVANHGTMVISVPYKRIIVRDAAFRYRTYAFGNAGVGGRFNLAPLMRLSPRDALALSVTAGIPLGYTRNYAPSAGSGQVDLQGVLAYGRSLYPAPFYLQFGAGYRYRSRIYALSRAIDCNEGSDVFCQADRKPDFGDEVLLMAETGATFGRLFLQVLANAVWSVEPPTTGFSVANPVPTLQRYVKTGAGVAVILPDGATVNVQAFMTPYGRNTVKSVDLYFGFDYRLDYRK